MGFDGKKPRNTVQSDFINEVLQADGEVTVSDNFGGAMDHRYSKGQRLTDSQQQLLKDGNEADRKLPKSSKNQTGGAKKSGATGKSMGTHGGDAPLQWGGPKRADQEELKNCPRGLSLDQRSLIAQRFCAKMAKYVGADMAWCGKPVKLPKK